MRLDKVLVLIIGVFLILIGTNTAFSKEENISQSPLVQESGLESEVQWIWGEVTSVDAVNNKVNVRYLDFENDIEKEIDITADEKTTYDNIGSINQLKPNDIVSIDYISVPGGVNIAKNVSIERPEEIQSPLPVPKDEASIEDKKIIRETERELPVSGSDIHEPANTVEQAK
ncbi:MAG: hypothetical protein V2A64_04895 [Candidatus Omnitrophota bacterium]